MPARAVTVVAVGALIFASACTTAKTKATSDYRSYGAGSGNVVTVKLDAVETVQEIAAGVKYQVWTFGGTAPGPVIRVKQGDTVRFTLANKSTSGLSHSIDFHAAQTPWDVNYKPVAPGQTLSFDWVARFPGVFMYHCGVPPVLHHIANGMYGAIIVEPDPPLPKAREYVLVSSEYYVGARTAGVAQGDTAAMLGPKPDYYVFNGRAGQYLDHPLEARPNELIRLWVMNAGPTITNAFHVIGALFDHVYPDGNPTSPINGSQTWNVPPGGGAMFELSIPDEGLYPFVTHAFAYTGLGSIGVIKVAKDAAEAPTSYPMIADPFTGGLNAASGEWSGKPPKPAFALKPPAIAGGPAKITMKDVKFDPSALHVDAGAKITLNNADPLLHDLTIDVLTLKVVVDANKSGTFSLKQPGTYEFYCSVPGHREAGMTGTITVKAAGSH